MVKMTKKDVSLLPLIKVGKMKAQKSQDIKVIKSQSMFEAAKEIEYTGVFTFGHKIGCFFEGIPIYYTTIEVAQKALEVFIEMDDGDEE